MNKRFWISVIGIFVLWMLLDFVIHGQLLHGDYSRFPNLYRSEAEAQNYFPFMLFAHLLMAFGFVWIYNKGREQKPFLGQGIRYGLAIALLTTIPWYLIYYVVMPLPLDMVMKQILFGTIEMIVLGIAVAWLNK